MQSSRKLLLKNLQCLLLFTVLLTAFAIDVMAQNQPFFQTEAAVCKITVDNKTYQPKLNLIGYFSKVRGIKLNTAVPVELSYPGGTPGGKVVISAVDGGLLDNNKTFKVLSLDNEKKVSFNFQANTGPGLYRITSRKGNDTKTVQLWADPQTSHSIAAADAGGEQCGNNAKGGPGRNRNHNSSSSCDEGEGDEGGSASPEEHVGRRPVYPNYYAAGVNPLDPYTGNVSREIHDLKVWGSVGEMPLEWVRYANSRVGIYPHLYGEAHNWNSSYMFWMEDDTADSGHPQILIHYPEGGEDDYVQDSTDKSHWKPALGIDKQLFQYGDEFYLQTAEGYRYHFLRTTHLKLGVFHLGWEHLYLLQDIVDPYQNLYRITYKDGKLYRITEPAGRYLEITYGHQGDNNLPYDVITHVTTSDGRWVQYRYSDTSYDGGLTKWVELDSVLYNDGTYAVYNYIQAQPGMRPSLEHAIDPRVDGQATNMRYRYGSYITGFISDEINGITGEVMATLSSEPNKRRVCYPNGRVQTYVVPETYLGDIKTYIDGLGRTTAYIYDSGFVYKVFDKNIRLIETLNSRTLYGNPLEITYDDFFGDNDTYELWTRDNLDLPMSHTDELKRVTKYYRDDKHRIVAIEYPDTSMEFFYYNNYGEVTSHQKRNNGWEYHMYDARGLDTAFIDALGNKTVYGYDEADRLASVKDARGNTTAYKYNERGQVIQVTYPDTTTRTYGYDEFGNPTTVTNEQKKTWETKYDEFRRPDTLKDPLGRITQYKYDLPGGICGCTNNENKPTTVILPSGKTTTYTYDVEWEIRSKTEGAGTADAATTTYEYDKAGNLTTLIDPLRNNYVYEYDIRDRRTSVTDPLRHQTHYGYDKVGNLTFIIRPNGDSVNYEYDAMNRRTKVRDEKQQVTRMAYDEEGNLDSLTDAKQQIYVFNNDLLNRRTKMTYPDETYDSLAYDEVGNLKTYIARDGAYRMSTYDKRNRRVFSRWSDISTPSIQNVYDYAGRLHYKINTWSFLEYTYNDANELISEAQYLTESPSLARTVQYSYNADGLRDSMIYSDAFKLKYDYTGRNQLRAIYLPDDSVTYTYDLNGNRLSKNLPNVTQSIYAYDGINRLKTVDNQQHSVSFARFDYGYDNVDRRTFVKRNLDKGDVYHYDPTDQITDVFYGADKPEGDLNSFDKLVHYEWDAVGNRTMVTDSGVISNYNTNNLNQYNTVGSNTLIYDVKGNLETFNGWYANYDSENRLFRMVKGDTIINFAYDPLGRCIKRTANGTSTYYYYDGWNRIEESDLSGTQRTLYVHGGATDEILSKVSFKKDENQNYVPYDTVFYHYDGLGSVTQLTNKEGSVIEEYSYDVFGAPTIRSGGNVLQRSAYSNRFMFTSREYLQEIRLYDYRNRFYSPDLGRFIQVDPIAFLAGDYNLYRYVFNNSTNTTDLFGLESCKMTPQGPVKPNGQPAGLPGENWRWSPNADNNRGGTWKSGKQDASWDNAPIGRGGELGTPHWDLDNGEGERTRLDEDGNPVSVEEAHPSGSNTSESSSIDFRLPESVHPQIPPELVVPIIIIIILTSPVWVPMAAF